MLRKSRKKNYSYSITAIIPRDLPVQNCGRRDAEPSVERFTGFVYDVSSVIEARTKFWDNNVPLLRKSGFRGTKREFLGHPTNLIVERIKH
jgi:hypothetical protein